MKYYSLVICYCLGIINVMAQQSGSGYQQLIKTADSLYQVKDFKKSAFTYSEAFKQNGWKAYPDDRYNAACSWAMAGNKDSAFFNLTRIAEKSGYTNLTHILNDRDLTVLHEDARWKPLVEKIKDNKEKAEVGLNKPLVKQLDSIHDQDQRYRLQMDEVEKKYGRNSAEMQKLWSEMAYHDSLNLVRVKSILEKYGWLGPSEIGVEGSSTLFLVIQHADLKSQETYLPKMREAVKNGKASPANLALLEDRVLMRQGKKQLYGSQIGRDAKTGTYYVFALDDPDNVDTRRASMGLGSIAAYVTNWGIKWDLEAYKKQLPLLEKEMEKMKY